MALVEPPTKHTRLRDPSEDSTADSGRTQFPRLTNRITWPEHLLPADVEVSFGWEQDPREEIRSGNAAKLSSDLLLSPSESEEEEAESPNKSSTSTLKGTAPNATKGTQIALLIRSHSQGWARSFELHRNWPRPAIIASDEVLLRNVSMGLNPVDFKSLLYKFGIERFPWVLGRDVCGVVEQVGTDVKHLQVGQRVWTCSDSRDVRAGAYQAYSVSKGWTLGALPDHVADTEAATIGTGLVTAGVALYWFFGLDRPKEIGGGHFLKEEKITTQGQKEPTPSPSPTRIPWLLIFGGGAVTGIYAAQLAHLSGVRVISVASPENFDYLHSIGVDVCVDRYGSEEEILDQVHKAVSNGDATSPGRLVYALDCVGSTTAALCQRALQDGADPSEPSPQLICLAGNPKRPRESDEANEDAPRAQVITHRISFSTTFYGQPDFTTAFLSAVHDLFASGSLKPVRAQLVPHGLAGVRTGLEMLRNGSAPRAKKLVVRMQDTPDVELTNLGVKEELSWNGCI